DANTRMPRHSGPRSATAFVSAAAPLSFVLNFSDQRSLKRVSFAQAIVGLRIPNIIELIAVFPPVETLPVDYTVIQAIDIGVVTGSNVNPWWSSPMGDRRPDIHCCTS